jgi:predicted urease superfamily metal-dependent hydrolase
LLFTFERKEKKHFYSVFDFSKAMGLEKGKIKEHASEFLIRSNKPKYGIRSSIGWERRPWHEPLPRSDYGGSSPSVV